MSQETYYPSIHTSTSYTLQAMQTAWSFFCSLKCEANVFLDMKFTFMNGTHPPKWVTQYIELKLNFFSINIVYFMHQSSFLSPLIRNLQSAHRLDLKLHGQFTFYTMRNVAWYTCFWVVLLLIRNEPCHRQHRVVLILSSLYFNKKMNILIFPRGTLL